MIQRVWIAWILAAGCSLGAGLDTAGAWHVFKASSGAIVRARYEGMADGKVQLRRDDGKLLQVAPDLLGAADRAYIEDLSRKTDAELEKLNGAAGHALFGTAPFEARKAEGIAAALGLPKESDSKYSKSWRLYAAFQRKRYELFGAMPYSVALYAGEDGNAVNLSVVYANKGDFGSKAGFGEEHFQGAGGAAPATLDAAMNQDADAVAGKLTAVLGEPKKQRFGEDKSRRTIQRWDWNGQSLLLSREDGEYVSLAVVSQAFADAGGRTVKVSGTDLRQRLATGVVREANGDVYVSNIPMVNQGPKGYCVPATFERAMRTMGIEADMYLLAMVGGTSAGGGTSVELLLKNVRTQVYVKGRRTKDEAVKTLHIRDIKRYIDEGVPVMWPMLSVEEYNKTADENTSKRKEVKDWAAYAQEIAAQADSVASGAKPDSNHHLCMIIGYNEATGELAVSDSWGPRFERRWVPVKIANWVSQGNLFLILP
jgi:hypothetical protein